MKKEKDTLIRELDYDCPFCDSIHKVQMRKKLSKALVKNEEVEYEEEYFYCPLEDDIFTPSKILDENLLKAKDVYRKTKGYLTSQEIKSIRKYYDLNQKEFSNLLGWGDVTIQRYESKLIQDETYDNVIRMVAENPSFALTLLDKHKTSFQQTKYNEIRDVIKSKIKEKGNISLKIQEIKNYYIDFEEGSDFNGYKKLDIDKVNKILGYFAQFVKPLFKVKLMKLLWYADALHFKRHGNSMTGLVYQHLPMGAVPIGYNELISLPAIQVEEEFKNDYIAYRILPKEDINLSNFLLIELEILQTVANFFGTKNTSEVVGYMHEEIAYLETDPNQIIPYSLAEKVREFTKE